MFVIGIDPHRGSHAAAALDDQEHLRAVLQLSADRTARRTSEYRGDSSRLLRPRPPA